MRAEQPGIQGLYFISHLVEDTSILSQAERWNITASYAYKLVQWMIEKNFCTSSRKGRECHIEFIPEGLKFRDLCARLTIVMYGTGYRKPDPIPIIHIHRKKHQVIEHGQGTTGTLGQTQRHHSTE